MLGWGGGNGETDVSNAGWHIEEKKQLIYGMNYGMTVKSFSDSQIQTDKEWKREERGWRSAVL